MQFLFVCFYWLVWHPFNSLTKYNFSWESSVQKKFPPFPGLFLKNNRAPNRLSSLTAPVSCLLCVSTAALMMFRGRRCSVESHTPLPWCEKHIPSPVHVLSVFPQNCHSGENARARYSLLFVNSEASTRSKTCRRRRWLQLLPSGDVPGAGVSNLNTAPYRAAKTLNN